MIAPTGPPLPDALADPASYAWPCDAVEHRETHGSHVFLAGDHALKVKKPIALPFMDYSTRERRGAMCREELRLNRRLAPSLYLGTVGIERRPDGGARLIAADDSFDAVEPAVLMRRYDERDTLAARIDAGRATPAQLQAVGRRLAAFHAGEARRTDTVRALMALRAAMRTTLDDLEDAYDVAALRGTLEALLTARRGELLERGRRGLVVDGHGDLRAEHVLLTDPVQVVDAVEFDPALRIADVACDLGFLVMDLEGRGATELAEALVAGYRSAGGDPGDASLLALMACYRALVRAKVDLVRAREGLDGRRRADDRIAQARRASWHARGPLLIAVCGPPAAGKSTLARALCAQSDMVRVSSDRVRKAMAGVAPSAPAPPDAYSTAATLETYRVLGEHAAAALATGRGAVVDATLGDPRARDALRAGLGGHGRMLVVECRVPEGELRRRAAAREPGESDAGPEVVARLGAAWRPPDETPAGDHLILRADGEPERLVAAVSAWLDRHGPRG